MRLPALVATAVLLLPLAACGDDEPTTAPTTPSPTPTATETTPDLPASSADLELAPGRVGPVEAGMSKADAEATGLFDVDVTSEACEGTDHLVWKKQYEGVDVLTDQDGVVVSLGVGSADGPRTEKGLGVDSTFGELIETYGGDLSAPEEAGYGQVGVYVQDGDTWLGFLFGEATSIEMLDNDPGLKVTFAEATTGDKPGLMRDGC